MVWWSLVLQLDLTVDELLATKWFADVWDGPLLGWILEWMHVDQLLVIYDISHRDVPLLRGVIRRLDSLVIINT